MERELTESPQYYLIEDEIDYQEEVAAALSRVRSADDEITKFEIEVPNLISCTDKESEKTKIIVCETFKRILRDERGERDVPQEQRTSNGRIKVFLNSQKVVICRQQGRYCAFPFILKRRLRNDNFDTLFVTFAGDKPFHGVDCRNTGAAFVATSIDGGSTWNSIELVYNEKFAANAGLDMVVKPGIGPPFIRVNSVVVENNYDGANYCYNRLPDSERIIAGRYQTRRPNLPLKWEDQGRVEETGNASYHRVSVGINEDEIFHSASGRIMLWDKSDLKKRIVSPESFVWPIEGRYAKFSETSAVQTPNGMLVQLSRFKNKKGEPTDIRLRQVNLKPTKDNKEKRLGDFKNWNYNQEADGIIYGVATPTKLQGFPAHLLVLRNNWLLAVYGNRTGRRTVRAAVNRDTENYSPNRWEDGIVLTECFTGHAGSDMGYPCSVELEPLKDADDNIIQIRIFTVFYRRLPPKPGENNDYPCVMGISWAIEV